MILTYVTRFFFLEYLIQNAERLFFCSQKKASKHQNLLLVLKYMIFPIELLFSKQASYNQTVSLILKGSINSLSLDRETIGTPVLVLCPPSFYLCILIAKLCMYLLVVFLLCQYLGFLRDKACLFSSC